MLFSEAFARYGAKLRNIQWAVSTIHDGQLIVSCWQHLFKSGEAGELAYEDRLSRFSGAGNNLLREHLEQAVAENLPVRAVIATTSDRNAINKGKDASKLKNTFSVRKDWIGQVDEFDGDFFRITFKKE